MIRTKHMLLLFSCCLCTSKTQAGSYHNEATVYGAAMSHDDQFDGHVLWMEFEDPQGGLHYATSVMLNPWYGLTSAHIFAEAGFSYSNHLAGLGDNYLTNRGETFLIDDFGMHPSWTGTFAGGELDEVDLAWFKLDQPIQGAGVGLGVAEIDDTLIVPEFGNPATPSGYLPIDGERRAFDAVADSLGDGTWNSDYLVSNFYPNFVRNMPLAGNGTPGSSGSPWFNDHDELVGITSSQTGTPNHGSRTGAVNLALHHDWIIATTTVPEPATLSLVLIGGTTILRRRVWRRFA